MNHLLPDPLRRAFCIAAAAGSLLGLCSCGGGAAVALVGGGVGTGGTGIVLGTVVGLGSVLVDGNSFSSATPTYYNATGSSGETETNSQAVEVGARVQLQLQTAGSALQPRTLLIQPELQGAPSYDASTGRVTVEGVPVVVNTSATQGPVTFYSGLTGLDSGSAPAASAAQIEVHGAFAEDSSGQPYIQASLIELVPASSSVRRLTGVVSALSAQSLSVAGQSIPLGAGTTVLAPQGAALAVGELVHTWTDGSRWVVSVQGLGSFAGKVQMGGIVYAMGAGGFTLSGIPVDTRSLSSVPALRNGDYAVVSGYGDGHGTLVAQSIQAAPTTVNISGTITGYVSASSLQVRGVPIDASKASYAAGSSATQLGNGAYVVIQGTVSTLDPNVITASSVQVLSAPPPGETVDLQGSVSALTDASHFTLDWQQESDNGSTVNPQQARVAIAPNCVYINGSAADLTAGKALEVEGTYQNGSLSAYTIKILPSGSSGGSTTQDVSGRVYNWSQSTSLTTTSGPAAASSTFTLGGNTLTIPAGTSIPAGFGDGVSVEVTFDPGTNDVVSIALDN